MYAFSEPTSASVWTMGVSRLCFWTSGLDLPYILPHILPYLPYSRQCHIIYQHKEGSKVV